MSDTYDATYQAVRSRIGHCDTSEAVQSALREAFGNADHVIRNAMQDIASAYTDPHVVMRPKLSIEGDQWCALYGEDLMNGVVGFGASPYEAMAAFNRAWWEKIVPASATGSEVGK